MGKHSEAPMTMEQLGKSFLSGGIAGMISKTFIAPVERIKFLYVVGYVGYSDEIGAVHVPERPARLHLHREDPRYLESVARQSHEPAESLSPCCHRMRSAK